MRKLQRYKSTLKLLKKATPDVRRTIINYSPKSLIDLFVKSAREILDGKCKINRREAITYSDALKKIASKNFSYKQKKSIIQKGGSIGLLLKAV